MCDSISHNGASDVCDALNLAAVWFSSDRDDDARSAAASSAGDSSSHVSMSTRASLDSLVSTCKKKCCKWCFAIRGLTPNPLRGPQQQSKPTIPWVKSDRMECDICRGFIEWKHKHEKKSDLERKLQEACERQAFLDCRNDYIEVRNSSGRALVLAPRSAVVSTNEEGVIETPLAIGILWPLDLWKQQFNKPVPQERVETITRRGNDVTGIMEGVAHGEMSGCTEINDIHREGVTRSREVESAERVGEDLVNAVQQVIARTCLGCETTQ